jgi:hypothetical protein
LASISSRSAPSTAAHALVTPLSAGAVNGITIGPLPPAAPRWMCAPTAGSWMFDTVTR